ncbi:MAG: rhomboid family intramembrane serine protease [Pseudomonadota bacterium]
MSQNIYTLQRQSQLPNVIFALLVINGLAFALRVLGFVPSSLALWPVESPLFAPWQLLTYGFLHGGVGHIFFNMFGLWMFGRDLEHQFGAKRFLIYYLTCVVGAGLVQLLVAAVQGGIYPTVGASGGVFGILLAYGMSYPNRTILLLIPPIPMPAKYMVILYGILELYLGVSGRSPGVANFAHLGGMLFGLGLLLYWRNQRRR